MLNHILKCHEPLSQENLKSCGKPSYRRFLSSHPLTEPDTQDSPRKPVKSKAKTKKSPTGAISKPQQRPITRKGRVTTRLLCAWMTNDFGKKVIGCLWRNALLLGAFASERVIISCFQVATIIKVLCGRNWVAKMFFCQ